MKALREQQQRSEGSNPVEQGAGVYGEVAPPLARTVSLTARVCGLGLNGDSEKEKKEKRSGIALPPPSPSQGSIGSSGISEAESQQGQGNLITNNYYYFILPSFFVFVNAFAFFLSFFCSGF